MSKDKAQETAEKVASLSINMFEVVLQASNMMASIEAIQDKIHESAHLLADIAKELPPEVREKLKSMKAGDIEADKDSGGFVDWLKRMLKDGGN